MKKMAVALALLMFVGCSWMKGEKGDPGIGEVYYYSGPVMSDDFTVECSKMTDLSILSVFIYGTDGYIEIPAYSPVLGANIFYIAGYNTVRIQNASTPGFFAYKIGIVNGAREGQISKLIP